MTGTKILDALNVLREGGVVEGCLVDEEGRHCALGALRAVYKEDMEGQRIWVEEYRADRRALAAVALEQHRGATWNGIDAAEDGAEDTRVAVTFNHLAHNRDMAAIETWFEKAALRRVEEL